MKVGIFILFLILAFKIRYDAHCGHVTYRLYSVELSSSCTQFVESFYHNCMSIFIKCFFLHILSWSDDFHPLFWMWCITLVVGVTSTSSLHSWNKSLFVKNIYLFRSWCGSWDLPLRRVESLVVVHRFSCSETCVILVPWPRIKPTSPALQDRFLTTGAWRKSLE